MAEKDYERFREFHGAVYARTEAMTRYQEEMEREITKLSKLVAENMHCQLRKI